MEDDRKKFYDDVKNAEDKSNKISIEKVGFYIGKIDYKNPLVVILVAVIAILFLYYTLSPYQNCKRYAVSEGRSYTHCFKYTSW